MSADVDLPELRRLAEAATKGPWAWDGMGPESMVSLNADARFIAASGPDVVLALLDRIDALEAELAAADFDPADIVIPPIRPNKVTHYRMVPVADPGAVAGELDVG